MEKHHCMEMLPVCVPVEKEEKHLRLLKHDPKRKQDHTVKWETHLAERKWGESAPMPRVPFGD